MKLELSGLLVVALAGCAGTPARKAFAPHGLSKEDLLDGQRVRVVYIVGETPYAVLDSELPSWPRPMDIELVENTLRKLQRDGAYISPLPVTLENIDFFLRAVQHPSMREKWDYLMITDPSGFATIAPENLARTIIPKYDGRSISFDILKGPDFIRLPKEDGFDQAQRHRYLVGNKGSDVF